MRLNRLWVLILLALVFTPLVAMADCPTRPAFFDDVAVAAPAADQPLEAIFASSKTGPQSKSNTMNGNGQANGLLACEWFTISCANGTTDTCCGSVSSCLVYCEQVCGEACVYTGGAQPPYA